MPLLPGEPPVPIVLRRSSRARRYSLRVSRLDGRVTLTLPAHGSEVEALAFARARAEWVRTALAQMPGHRVVAPGSRLPVEGREVALALGRGAPRIEDGELVVPGGVARAGVRAAAFLKALARARLAAACDRHAGALGRPYARMVLRDTRSRWGSCSAQGSLMFSWRLILAPPEVLDYVAAHEVAHLAQMNHSPAFWAEVARLMPGYAAPRRWLRAHGQELHSWRFEGAVGD